MKKWALLATLVVAAAFGALAAGSALATGTPTIVDRASGFPCGIFNADGSITITEQSRSYLYQNGKEVLHCEGQATGNGTVVNFDGFLCGMVFTGISSDPLNNARVSKSGWSQLWCYNRASDSASASSGPAGAIG